MIDYYLILLDNYTNWVDGPSTLLQLNKIYTNDSTGQRPLSLDI